MGKINSWISAARLRTLPLSVSGIIVGTTIAVSEGVFSITIFSLALATTLGLQVLSNFANDYGDGVKGTDNEDRVGPQRAIQSGLISQKEMFQVIVITAIVTLLFAVLLIYAAFGKENLGYALFFFLLGVGAIAAAIKYTVGKSAYGYRGLGDVFVLIFFGLVAVYGSYFLYAHQWNWLVLLPSFSIGFLSMGVLNLNNMRDRISDEKAGKNTLVVKLGAKNAKNYHYALILGAILCLVLFTVLTLESVNDFLYLPAFIPLILHLKRVVENENATLLDPELKILALSTFATAILFGLGQIW
ncbi:MULTISPECIES: 1,4-dihydroxy-2-naphthoate octaprenyltransferase [Salegentibacter]|uniref:1,4-dihydroxy-2-naphthoate octaprenyltransferase n=1 Tax=Salegentibacter agarivorans TaxID=345907 RepID=A0A1I2PMS5_9FLAO|nr:MULTISPECIES: 1,4-dihydroxy-2-naphthoate octaprenyltransferase [Salegentibacter]APS38900.1 1,4-dihydroxy-2-naphthoate octaprenyltransferase [Salegentibacter sp. T436]SFG17344.1 1,4-dihydroxy-2-naphthoate prenyltransferase [Salegentibacter agarivorans]